MVPILINNDVSEPSHNDLKFMVQNDNYFFTNLIHPISWDNYIGKEFSRKSVTEPISVQQGLAQHCKPTICQFKQRACLCDLPAFPWPYLPPLHLLLCRPVYRGRFAIWPPSHLRALHVLFPMSGRFSPETCCLSLTTTASVGLGSNVTTHRLSLAILLKINTFYLVCTHVHTHTHTVLIHFHMVPANILRSSLPVTLPHTITYTFQKNSSFIPLVPCCVLKSWNTDGHFWDTQYTCCINEQNDQLHAPWSGSLKKCLHTGTLRAKSL